MTLRRSGQTVKIGIMDKNVNIDKIAASLEKKFNGDERHDIRVIQEYCQTLPPCEESAKVISALGRYASKKYPNAEVFRIGRKIDAAIAELEKQFNGDPDHDVQVVRDYCKDLPKSEENLKITLALGQFAAAKFPQAEIVKKSKEDYDKMQSDAAKLKTRLDAIQETIKNGDYDKAIEDIQGVIAETPIPNDPERRLVSFSHPFEEILFKEKFNETRMLVRISNFMEVIHLELGGLLLEKKRFDEARDAINKALDFNPVSNHAMLEMAHSYLVEGDYNAAFNELQKAYPLLFSRPMLAIYFCFLGEVAENLDKDYELAATCCHISNDFAENKGATDLLERLATEHHVKKDKPNFDKIQQVMTDAGLPFGASVDVCQLAMKAGRELKPAYPDIAVQIFGIAYDLTGDKEILKEMK